MEAGIKRKNMKLRMYGAPLAENYDTLNTFAGTEEDRTSKRFMTRIYVSQVHDRNIKPEQGKSLILVIVI